MRTHIIAAVALAGASVLTLNAQSGQPQQRPDQQRPPQEQQRPAERAGDTTQRSGQNAGQTVTVTGCLKVEKDVAERRATTGNRPAGSDYVLTHVKMSPGSTTSGIGLASMYELEGNNTELQKHVNHQIEVTGTLSMGNQMGNRGAAAAGATGAGRSGGSQAAANADLAQLRATSIKMVSATCPAQ